MDGNILHNYYTGKGQSENLPQLENQAVDVCKA